MLINQSIENWIEPFIFLMGGIIIGLIIELFLFTRFRKVMTKIKWKGFEIFAKSLRFMPTIWFFMLGLYGAITSINPEELNIDPKFITLLSEFIFIIAVVSIMIILARIVNGFILYYTSKTEGAMAATSIATNVTNFFFILLGIMIIIQSLGINITPLLTLLGIGGLTIALALQPTLINFFSGIYFFASGEFSVGDYIELDSGEEGYITDMNWRHIIIRPPSKVDIVIPNTKLASASVINYKISEKETVITIPIGVGYESDLDKVEKVTIEVAKSVIETVQGQPPINLPYIRFHTFAPSSIDFNAILYTRNLKDRARIKHEFIKQIFKRYQKEKIDIPFPTSVIYSKQVQTD